MTLKMHVAFLVSISEAAYDELQSHLIQEVSTHIKVISFTSLFVLFVKWHPIITMCLLFLLLYLSDGIAMFYLK